jgi:uncharacterized protein with HEPN domain
MTSSVPPKFNMQPDDATRIRHMVEAAETAERFIAGRQRTDLDTDQMLLFALIRAIEIIGEAASKVSLETRMATPSVPWPAIVSMRNRLIHAYFDIDRDIVWKTLTEEIPPLRSLLSTVVSKG